MAEMNDRMTNTSSDVDASADAGAAEFGVFDLTDILADEIEGAVRDDLVQVGDKPLKHEYSARSRLEQLREERALRKAIYDDLYQDDDFGVDA